MTKVRLLGAGRIGQVHAVNIATHPDTAIFGDIRHQQKRCHSGNGPAFPLLLRT